jgi:DNA-binding MarR family transcriptional regulator
LSRQSRQKLEEELGREVRGWQVDQDLFDDVLAMLAGMNRTDMRCLDVIGQQGPMTAGDLAAAVHLTSGAITAVLDRLEARGLVRRTRDLADRRRVLVEVAADLDALAAPVFGPFIEDAQRKLDTYSDRELAFLLRFLRDNREVLARHTTRLHELLATREAEQAGEQAAS